MTTDQMPPITFLAFDSNGKPVYDDIRAYARAYAEQQTAELRADAMRYRWLRDHGSCPWAETDPIWESAADMDAELDRAISANPV